MLTIDRTTTLHIFPTYGAWNDTDDVLVITTVGDLPISEAYNHLVYNYGERLVDRDTVFAAISLSEFRNVYDDVIMYAEPYKEMWCDVCECPRFPVPSKHWEGGIDCDACGISLTAPF